MWQLIQANERPERESFLFAFQSLFLPQFFGFFYLQSRVCVDFHASKAGGASISFVIFVTLVLKVYPVLF